jgi:hypothetical protein
MLNERRQAGNRAKVAARLVTSEVRVNDIALNLAVEKATWHDARRCSVDEWKRHRDTLASVMTDDDWSTVEAYCVMTEHLILTAERQREDQPIVDEFAETIRIGITTKTSAVRAALKRYGEMKDASQLASCTKTDAKSACRAKLAESRSLDMVSKPPKATPRPPATAASPAEQRAGGSPPPLHWIKRRPGRGAARPT